MNWGGVKKPPLSFYQPTEIKMKFKFVKRVRGIVKTYEGKEVATGEEIEFTGHFAEKALKNPDYEKVDEAPAIEKPDEEPVSTPEADAVESQEDEVVPIPKKRGRPAK